jgi:hypothetical protein
MKTTAFAATIISGLIVLLIFGVQFIQPVESNGIVMHIPMTYDGPPIMTIESPSYRDVVSFNTVVVSFTLTRPGSGWTSELETSNKVVSVSIIVDGAVYRSVDVNSELLVPFSYSLNLTDLQNGAHSLQLNAYCRGVNATITYPSHSVLNEKSLYYEASSYVVSFTVDVPVKVPEPFLATLVIASVITAAVYGIRLLVHFKKRKH